MLRGLPTILSALSFTLCLFSIALWLHLLLGQSYKFGEGPGPKSAVHAEKGSILIRRISTRPLESMPAGRRFDVEKLCDLPGLTAARMDVIPIFTAAGAPPSVNSMTIVNVRVWLLIVLFGIFPTVRFAMHKWKVRSNQISRGFLAHVREPPKGGAR